MRLALPPIMLHNLSPRAFLYDAVLYWEINLIWFIWFDDTYRSIANGCWLITSARVYCQCGPLVAPYTDIYTKKWRQISSASLPERHGRAPKQSYIDFGDNFNFGELVCRRVVQLPMILKVCCFFHCGQGAGLAASLFVVYAYYFAVCC